MEQPEVKLCEVGWQRDGIAAQANWFLATIPVCDDHSGAVCGRCERRWATKVAKEEERIFNSCDECYMAIERQDAKRQTYNQHLSSKQWWKTKRTLRRESRHEHGTVLCSRCGMSELDNKQTYGEGLHGHHKTYERFGQEKSDDVELLC